MRIPTQAFQPGFRSPQTSSATRMLLAVALSVLLLPALALAQASTYTWHDGTREHTITLDPALVVEYGAPADAGSSALQRSAPAAEPVSRQGQVTLWRLPEGSSNSAVNQARSLDAAARVSPVFRDGTAGTGALRALTGRLVVRFAEETTSADAAAWGTAHGLVLVRTLPLRQPHYLYAGPLGIALLEQANALRQQPEVAAAFPDWWQPRNTR